MQESVITTLIAHIITTLIAHIITACSIDLYRMNIL